METNYYTGLTIPLCKTCNMELVSPKIFKKFRRSTTKNGIGDNASLKEYISNKLGVNSVKRS